MCKMGVKLLFAFCSVLALTWAQNFPPIGGDNASTMRILQRLCQPGNHNDDVAARFFGCWAQDGPGLQQAEKCQYMVFGALQNTKCQIDKACMGGPAAASRTPMYLGCLQKELAAAGLNFDEIATRVNICMAKVLGLE